MHKREQCGGDGPASIADVELHFNTDRTFSIPADLLPEAVFITNGDGTVRYMNRTGIEFFGDVSGGTEPGPFPESFVIAEDRDRFKDQIENHPEADQEYTALKKDGTPFPVIVRTRNRIDISDTPGVIGVIRDNTYPRNLESALRKAEKISRDIFQTTSEYWVLCDFEGNFIESSITYNSDYNITENDLAGLNICDFLQDESRDTILKNLEIVREQGKSNVVVDVTLKEGDVRSYDVDLLLVFEDGVPSAVRILSKDVTEQVAAKKRLEISEARYRSVFENTGLPTAILEGDLRIAMVNVKFEEMTGFRKDQIEGEMTLSRFIEDDWENQITNRFLEETDGPTMEIECRVKGNDGEIFDMLIRVGDIPGTTQKIASFTDITSRKKVETNLIESRNHLQKQNILLRSSMKERFRFGDIIGKSEAMQEIYETVVRAAESNANVVVYGESGTGKELVARAIHRMSRRSGNRFVTVNCGAIPGTMIESEFFGYRKGAFTGAYADKPGYLDLADEGTLFLDEVGEIDTNMQVKLLRIIDNGDFIPLGSNMIRRTDIRIIAATNRNLMALIKSGIIREDFFYRIHIIPIFMPPLRDRKEDIPLLLDHFVKMHGGPQMTVDNLHLDPFLDYDWPGNVRELQNVVHRYVSMKKIDLPGSPSPRRSSVKPAIPKTDDGNLIDIVNSYEKEVIESALNRHKWHRGRVADALGINRKTLFTKIMKYGLNRSQNRAE